MYLQWYACQVWNILYGPLPSANCWTFFVCGRLYCHQVRLSTGFDFWALHLVKFYKISCALSTNLFVCFFSIQLFFIFWNIKWQQRFLKLKNGHIYITCIGLSCFIVLQNSTPQEKQKSRRHQGVDFVCQSWKGSLTKGVYLKLLETYKKESFATIVTYCWNIFHVRCLQESWVRLLSKLLFPEFDDFSYFLSTLHQWPTQWVDFKY